LISVALILRPGPELVLRAFRPEPDELDRRPKERDVTDRAHEFLFEAITLHPDTEWGVSLTPLRELLALPVRVNHGVRITEDDQAAQAWMQEIGRAHVEVVTLGPVLEGLLWELSFHGGPAEQEAVAEDLRQRVAEVHDGTAKTVASDEVFERLGLPGCEGLFDELGGHRPREIDQALRDIGDVENAADWMARKFEGRVIVKPEFRTLNGRGFRRARQSLRR